MLQKRIDAVHAGVESLVGHLQMVEAFGLDARAWPDTALLITARLYSVAQNKGNDR